MIAEETFEVISVQRVTDSTVRVRVGIREDSGPEPDNVWFHREIDFIAQSVDAPKIGDAVTVTFSTTTTA